MVAACVILAAGSARAADPALVEAAKKEGEAHRQAAPAALRESEATQLAGAKTDAQDAGTQATTAMAGARSAALAVIQPGDVGVEIGRRMVRPTSM